jgi:DNA-directed DNA polymerase III PolC
MPSPEPVYLRAHSYFGFLESFLSPEDLAHLANSGGIRTLALTDHKHLSGALEFYTCCRKVDITPILGLEIDLQWEGHSGLFTLLAKDRQGWSNLCRVSSRMALESRAMTLSDLTQCHQGLIAIAGGHRGLFRDIWETHPNEPTRTHTFLSELHSLFHQDFFIEIQRFTTGPLPTERALVVLARDLGIDLIATQDIFYGPDKSEKHYRTLTAIRRNAVLQNLSQDQLPPGPAHFPDWKDFRFRFRDLPEALENLAKVADRCNLSLPLGERHYPAFPTPEGKSQADHLKEKAFQGARKRYVNLTPEIEARLEHELEIISNMGYEPIFLIVQDVLQHARDLGIPTSSRGSAASSLVAYCLGITTPDPLALNLFFERFLNPARKKPPDIDTDIASHRREEVIRYVFDAYGEDHVAMVGTITRYRPKSALGDAAKAYGLSPEAIRQLSKKLPHAFRFQRDGGTQNPFTPLLQKSTIPIIKEITADAIHLLDMPRHLSVHPGGILVAPFPITDLVPLVHSASLDINHAQFDLEGIDQLGLVKIDLLGIRGLTVLGEVANRIHSWRSKEFSDGLEVLEKIPLNDPETAATIRSAKTIGCFQIESPGMRATLQEIQADSVEDIMAALALYRPGPLRGGLRDAFVRRFRGEEPIAHIHPSLEDLLGNTYGVILYQEQVLRIAHDLGGLSIAQADILRRAMSHFDPGGVMDTLRKNFIEGAQRRRGVPPETAERIWEMMAAFAGYGFPKAHAASYAQLSWNSSWCKAHFPAEFMAAVLGYGGGYYSQRVYLMEARRLGLNLQAPHINHSQERFCVRYPGGEATLYMGLHQVRDLTHNTCQEILQKQPFDSLEDFLLRVDPQKKEARHLILCGALEGLTTIPEGLECIQHTRPPGQMNLFSQSTGQEEWSQEKKLEAQRNILGVSLTLSPLEEHADQIRSAGAITTLEALSLVGERVTLAGMRQSLRRFRTRHQGMMCFLNVEDLDGGIQVKVSPRLYRRCHQILQKTGPYLITGNVEEDTDRGRIWIQADNIILLG